MHKLLLIVFMLSLVGCTTTKTVYVPTQCPKPHMPPVLHTPIQDYSDKDDDGTVTKRWVASALMWKDGYLSCRKTISE